MVWWRPRGRTLLLTGLMPCLACAGEADQTGPVHAPAEIQALDAAPADATRFEARLEIDAKPGGKRFQGVWLADRPGHRWLIAYRADPWWRPFEGKRVEVVGESYQPQGQAIGADHFRVHELRLIEPGGDDELIFVSGELELEGRFIESTWPEGTKLAGETETLFRSDAGVDFRISSIPEGSVPAHDEQVRVVGRQVEPSPFVARPGGPYLWVITVD